MHIKRTLALILTLCCLLTVLPVNPVQAVTHSELFDLIAKQYDAYAASIVQPNAADDTVEQLLNHGLYGKHKTLHLGPSDALTACAFGSVLFREAMIDTVAYALEALHNNQDDNVLMLFSINWYTNKKSYGVREVHYNTTADYEDDIIKHELCANWTDLPLNRNDDAMLLVVGGSVGRLWLDRDPVDPCLYHVRIAFYDRFDFNQNLSSAMEKFDGTLSSILNILGPILGFKSFDWYSTVNFDVRLPMLCSHESGDFRWEASGEDLISVSGEGLTENPLHRHTTTNGTYFYYELEDPVYLRHQDPWVMEFRYKGNRPFYIGPHSKHAISHNYFLRKSKFFFVGQALPGTPEDSGAEGSTRYHYGFQTDAFAYKEWHTFRIENRIADNGTNMLWLLIDGQEMGPLDSLYMLDNEDVEVNQNVKSDWASNRDFIVRYIGNNTYPLRGELEYLTIRQNAQPITTDTLEATCTKPGSVLETCSLCGITSRQDESAPLGHEANTLPGQAPTCEAPGFTESSACTRCGEVLSPAQTLPALGHDPITIPGKDPLCETDGLTEGTICAVCNKTLTAQQPVPALGHSYETGLCAQCGISDPSLLPGDADFDGILTYNDALLVLRMSIGLDPIQPVHRLLCDTDSDETLTYNDALTILRHSIGLD